MTIWWPIVVPVGSLVPANEFLGVYVIFSKASMPLSQEPVLAFFHIMEAVSASGSFHSEKVASIIGRCLLAIS